MTSRQRLDKALVNRELARSRSQAKRYIERDKVLVNGFPADKPATLVEHNDHLTLRDEGPDWVGRGARKIYPLLEQGVLDPTNQVCIDVGSSTGGFTQALLEAGGRMVHAVDAGYGQLVNKLRRDERVQVYEQTNFRHAESGDFSPEPERFTMDVSFISVIKLLPALNRVMKPESSGLILVKPQFEAGPDQNVDGIIEDPQVTRQVLNQRIEQMADHGWGADLIQPSPLAGTGGNQEYFVRVRRDVSLNLDSDTIHRVVEETEEQAGA